MTHTVTIAKGTNPRNHTAHCTCGWAFSSTSRAVLERSLLHQRIFATEQRRWNDPRRQASMPGSLQS